MSLENITEEEFKTYFEINNKEKQIERAVRICAERFYMKYASAGTAIIFAAMSYISFAGPAEQDTSGGFLFGGLALLMSYTTYKVVRDIKTNLNLIDELAPYLEKVKSEPIYSRIQKMRELVE